MYDLIFSDKDFIIIIEIFRTKPTKAILKDIINIYQQHGFIGTYTLEG
jgi:hypothetical protein